MSPNKIIPFPQKSSILAVIAAICFVFCGGSGLLFSTFIQVLLGYRTHTIFLHFELSYLIELAKELKNNIFTSKYCCYLHRNLFRGLDWTYPGRFSADTRFYGSDKRYHRLPGSIILLDIGKKNNFEIQT